MTTNQIADLTPRPERCGALTRRGTLCRKGRGNATEHPGLGRCSHHGGCTPSHVTSARREMAATALGRLSIPYRVDVDPRDALQGAVDDADALRDALGRWVRDAAGQENPDIRLLIAQLELHRQAVTAAAKVAGAAVSANLSERQARLNEQQATVLVTVVNAAIAATGMPHDLAVIFRRALGVELRRQTSITTTEGSA